MKFQLPPEYPPSHMWPLAIWGVRVEDVEALGVRFSREEDDLDSFDYASIEHNEIGKIALLHRHRPPIDLGIDIEIQADVYAQDALEALNRLFGITEEDLAWVTPDPHYCGVRGELLDPPMTEADREREYHESVNWLREQVDAEKVRADDERFYRRVADEAHAKADELASKAPPQRPHRLRRLSGVKAPVLGGKVESSAAIRRKSTSKKEATGPTAPLSDVSAMSSDSPLSQPSSGVG